MEQLLTIVLSKRKFLLVLRNLSPSIEVNFQRSQLVNLKVCWRSLITIILLAGDTLETARIIHKRYWQKVHFREERSSEEFNIIDAQYEEAPRVVIQH